MSGSSVPLGRAPRSTVAGVLAVSLLALTGCSAFSAPSGIWFRVVDGELEVSPCRDLDIERISLEASLVGGGNDSARWEGDTVSVAVGEVLRVPPAGWTGDALDVAISDASAWDLITVNLAGPAGDHRSNLFGPSETWDYAATGGFFGVNEADECDAPLD